MFKMNRNLLFVFVGVCVLHFGQARDIKEVQEDFEHVFDEQNNQINHLENLVNHQIAHLLNDLKQQVSQEQGRSEDYNKNLDRYIEENKDKIIKDAGLGDRSSLAQPCVDQAKRVDFNNLVQRSIGAMDLCAAYTNQSLTSINSTILSMQYELYNMHLEIEFTRRECAPKTHPLEMQDCLVANLYERTKPMVADFKKQVEDLYGKVHLSVQSEKSELTNCANIAMIGSTKNFAKLINDLKSCVERIADENK